MSTPLSIVEARKQFSSLVGRASFGGERIILSKNGRCVAAVVPMADLELLQALEDKIDLADARAALNEARKKGAMPLEALKHELGL
ncbi:MAG: type II toxin-antitoxin system Phd/YefM family antitoxin [bacterium]|nr:type II toxin-antitoxin system Phd/YefM family antitoxin [bacterium]